MPGTTTQMVTALFKDYGSAQRAFDAAIRRGYDKKEINLVMDKDTHERNTAPPRAGDLDPENREAGKVATGGIELGGPSGGTLGTIGAAVAAVGAALLLPSLGFV